MAATPAPQKRSKAAKSRGQNSIEHARARLHGAARSNAPTSMIPALGMPAANPPAPGLPTLSRLVDQNNEILRRLAAMESLLGQLSAVADGTHLLAKAIYSSANDDLPLLQDSGAGDDGDEPVSTVTSVDPSA